MNSLTLFGLIASGVCVAIAGVALFFDGHTRGRRLGREEGYNEGYQEGFGAARELATIKPDGWWVDAEVEVQKVREEIWK